jgi:hypothetical protein
MASTLFKPELFTGLDVVFDAHLPHDSEFHTGPKYLGPGVRLYSHCLECAQEAIERSKIELGLAFKP